MIKSLLSTTLFLMSICSLAQWNPIPDGHCFNPGGGSYFPSPPLHAISDNGTIFRYESYTVSASQGSAYDICKSGNDQISSSLFIFESSTIGPSCCIAAKVKVITDSNITYAIHHSPGSKIVRYIAGLGQTESLYLFPTYNYASTKNCMYGVFNPSSPAIIFSKIVNGITSSDTLNYANMSGLPNIFFVNDSLGFIVGKDTLNTDVLIRTENYGATWSKILNPVDVINDIAFKGDTGLAVGNGGITYRSFDKGYTWNLLSSFTTNKLTSVSISTSSLCYIAGDNATLFKTTDMGNSWAQESLTITADIDWVKATNTGGAYFQSQNQVYKQNYFISVKELKDDARSLTIYPNPTSSIINIQIDEKSEHRFSVFVINSFGKIVLESDKSSLDLSDISFGIYTVELKTSAGEVFRTKVVRIDN
ncbi:MAG: T9SS type A sorting domain-containing protein [Bacteroidota bacterium]